MPQAPPRNIILNVNVSAKENFKVVLNKFKYSDFFSRFAQNRIPSP